MSKYKEAMSTIKEGYLSFEYGRLILEKKDLDAKLDAYKSCAERLTQDEFNTLTNQNSEEYYNIQGDIITYESKRKELIAYLEVFFVIITFVLPYMVAMLGTGVFTFKNDYMFPILILSACTYGIIHYLKYQIKKGKKIRKNDKVVCLRDELEKAEEKMRCQ